MSHRISILFASRNSVYKTIPGLDVWDIDRNAWNWPGGNPGIFHPPCRLFCRLSHMSTAPESEKHLAYWSVNMVTKHGGILEHPSNSKLWDEAHLPLPGFSDQFGFTIQVDQYWFGHPGRKRTWLYICGIDRKDVPSHQLRLTSKPADIFAGGTREYVPGSRHGGLRSNTPIDFAKWLVSVAGRCEVALIK